MKHIIFKRIFAAGLAVMCVAAYAPTVGDVELFDTAIVASATDYDSGRVNARELRPGDTIATGVDGIASARDYTFILKKGTFGTGYPNDIREVCSEDVEVSGEYFRLSSYSGLQIRTRTAMYCPVNENGEYSGKLYVLDVTGDKITLGGYGNVTTCTATFTDAMIDKFRVRINSDFFAVDSSTDAAKGTAYTIKGDRNGNVEVWVIMPTGTTFTPSDITITMGDTALDVQTEQGVFDDDKNVSYCIYSFSRSSVTEDLVFDYAPDTILKTGTTYKQKTQANGKYYTRFVFVKTKDEIAGKNKVKFTATCGDKTGTFETEYYYTAVMTGGVKYVPDSEDSVLLVVTVTSSTDISAELKCTCELQ